MLIVHVIADLSTGGAEMALKRLIEAHVGASEFRHQIISLRGVGTIGRQLQASDIRVDSLGMRGLADVPGAVVRLIRRFRHIRPDVVHTWMYHSDLLGGLAARLVGMRHVIWGVRIAEITREMGMPRSTLILRRVCARLSSLIPERIVYVGQSARSAHERIGYSADRGVVITNGYRMPAIPDRTRLRSELNLPEQALIIGTAGRFSPQKNPKGFVQVAGRLARTDPTLQFVLIGRGFDLSNSELMEWIAATGFPDNFHLLGERTALEELLAGMDIFCLNSIGEGFPNVVAEAMSVGVPCIATDVGDTKYLLGDAGISVPPRDLDALADALMQMIVAGPEARESRGELGQRRIAEHFSLDSVVARYEALYREFCNREPLQSEAD